MKYIRFILDLMLKYKYSYLVIIILMAILAYTRSIIPQFLSFTIDYILLGNDSQFVSFFKMLVEQGDSQISQLLILISILVTFQFFRALLMLGRTSLAYHNSESIIFNLRQRVYNKMLNLPYKFYKKNNSGDLIQRTTTDIDVIRTFLSTEIVQFTWIIFIVTFTLYAMIKISFFYALITCSVVPFIFIVSFYYSRLIHKQYHLIDHNEGEMTDVIKENITNVEVVKAFGAQKFEYDKYIERSTPYYVELDTYFRYLAKLESSVQLLKYIQRILVILFGIILTYNGTVSVGIVILFTSYTNLLSNPIKMLGRLLSRVGRLTVAVDRVTEILASKSETIEELEPVLKGDIVFDNVSFMFDDDKSHALNHVSFKIKKGTRVAILGKTGSGKSTIVNLLSRLYDPTSGVIKIGEYDTSIINKKYLRRNIGVIVQEPYIFSRNIMENIGISRESIEFNSITETARIASIHEDIVDFKYGYETEVGEKGTTLSGGQKQRIAIARTLLSSNNILVFDDSLSAVDNETDRNIRESLSKKHNLTVLTITHKIQSILDYDQIIILDKGRVIQDGSVSELLSVDGYFRDLYNSQMGVSDEK